MTWIATPVSIHVDEVLASVDGFEPATNLRVLQHGGTLDGRTEQDPMATDLHVGDHVLLFIDGAYGDDKVVNAIIIGGVQGAYMIGADGTVTARPAPNGADVNAQVGGMKVDDIVAAARPALGTGLVPVPSGTGTTAPAIDDMVAWIW